MHTATTHVHHFTLTLTPPDLSRLQALCGPMDAHLRQIEEWLGICIKNRGHQFILMGSQSALSIAEPLIHRLYAATQTQTEFTAELLYSHYQDYMGGTPPAAENPVLQTRLLRVEGRTANQRAYLHRILNHTLNFGVGPAGTGKTFLAVAYAVHALEKNLVERLVLARPAVEAGEHLGFLPGTLSEKIDPYLQPLYDALHRMMGAERVEKLIEQKIIEVAPLAFMRGRTLNNAVILLDESQNTTRAQMKMFLTRLGFGSKVIITGDVSQVDLPRHVPSGLRHATQVLTGIPSISMTYFGQQDVVRHPLVQHIVAAYDREEALET
ncbi:MAG: PhoH family protein [Pseudomonadota bacterium]